MVTTGRDEQLLALADRLYEEYVRPLEGAHWGAFVAVTEDGRTVLGSDLLEVCERARALYGPGSFAFKVGERAVGRWRYGVA
jgi:hypothetical protein